MNNNRIETLEQAEEYLLTEMQEAGKIWGQLNSEGFKKGFGGSKAEYENWRVRAGDAYNYRKALVKELIAFIEKKFGVRYSSEAQLRSVINERNLSAPDWFDTPSENGNGVHQQELSLDAVPEPEPEPVEEIVLSAQSQKQHDMILERLQASRKACKLSQAEVGAFFGYTAKAVGHWETGNTPITLIKIFKLAAIYEVDPLWILTGERGLKRSDLRDVADYLNESLEALTKLMEGGE